MAKKARIGRPPKREKERKSVNFTFRSRGELRELLRAAAVKAGHSVSEEIERRLEESFQKGDRQAELEAIADRAAAKAAKREGGEAALRDLAADPEGTQKLLEMLRDHLLAVLPPQSGEKK
jgi:hypothetical protein